MSGKDNFLLYVKICERAESLGICKSSRHSAIMDVESADEHFNMRLQEWIEADDFNFAHDFVGIQNNIVRDKFPSTEFDCFVPRFAEARQLQKSISKKMVNKGYLKKWPLFMKQVLTFTFQCDIIKLQ